MFSYAANQEVGPRKFGKVRETEICVGTLDSFLRYYFDGSEYK